MQKINRSTTIGELQEYVAQFNVERGFLDETVEHKFMLMAEEVGELAKALRGVCGGKFADDTARTEFSEEVVDVLLLLISISDKLGVDIADAIEQKEAKNRTREWV